MKYPVKGYKQKEDKLYKIQERDRNLNKYPETR